MYISSHIHTHIIHIHIHIHIYIGIHTHIDIHLHTVGLTRIVSGSFYFRLITELIHLLQYSSPPSIRTFNRLYLHAHRRSMLLLQILFKLWITNIGEYVRIAWTYFYEILCILRHRNGTEQNIMSGMQTENRLEHCWSHHSHQGVSIYSWASYSLSVVLVCNVIQRVWKTPNRFKDLIRTFDIFMLHCDR